MPQEPSSRPQPQYWIKFLDPWMQDFYPVLGWGLAPVQGEHNSSQHLDKNRFPWLFAIFARKRSFALFCALLRLFLDLRLHSFVLICGFLRVCES